MPTPNSAPPTSSDSHGRLGRCATERDRSTSPASDSSVVPAIATATASSHIRIRPQWPRLTMSANAPIVQKLAEAAT